ncbi:MAG: hypothetical protein A4E63_03526 [Syntrophorhabdus sp. PtaU1.Bin050]|nr:MAG: hypothetical protein A4E63_03526 [Syntrophorhabdus sp. PtaU1.Bin050]
MRYIADLHIHSKHSRATSKDMCPEALWRWAQLKGIAVVGAGDFTHPAWFRELKEKFQPAGNGLFELTEGFRSRDVPDSCRAEVFFALSSEISCIYKKNGRTRKIHCLVLVPGFTHAAKINMALARIGNLNADGRPILGLDAKDLLQIVGNACPEAVFVPAHAWTPHFSVFGAESGFDSLEECFEELTPHIRAIETGLSSDPLMNRRLSALDRLTLISNSDAHSPGKLGREANIIEGEMSFHAMKAAIETGEGLLGTIEFFPEEGKYHYDGHRMCGVRLSPKETRAHGYLCPACGKKVTVGVMHRVERLADREEGCGMKGAPGFHSLVPLPEVLAEAMGLGSQSKRVAREYEGLLQKLGNEFHILLDESLDAIERAGSPIIREAVARVRSGKVRIVPGFDGEYGKIRLFEKTERTTISGQATLF